MPPGGPPAHQPHGAWGSRPPPPPDGTAPPPPPRRLGKLWIGAAVFSAVVTAGVVFLVTRDTQEPEKGIAGASSAAAGPSVKSRALDHAPSGCDVLLRLDITRILAAPAAVTHLAPVLTDLFTGQSDAPSARRTREFLSAAGIDPRRDLAEVLVCAASLEGPVEQQKLAVVLGGSFRPEAVVRAIARAEGDAGDPPAEFEGRKVGRTKSRSGEVLTVGQAADGAVVITNDAAFFQSAVRPSKNGEETYKIPVQADVAVVVGPDFFQRPAAAFDSPLSRHRAHVRRLQITASLAGGAGARGELRASMRDDAAAGELSSTATRLLDSARQQAPEGRFEAALLAPAKVRTEGADVVLEAPWTEAVVENAAKQAAAALRDAWERGALAL